MPLFGQLWRKDVQPVDEKRKYSEVVRVGLQFHCPDQYFFTNYMALSSVRQGCKVLMRSDAVVLPNCLATMACRMFVPAWALDHGLDPQRGLRKAGPERRAQKGGHSSQGWTHATRKPWHLTSSSDAVGRLQRGNGCRYVRECGGGNGLPQSIHQPNNQTVAGDPLVRSYQVFSRPDTPLRNIRL